MNGITPILHRVDDLDTIPLLGKTVGIEFDVHAYGDKLVVTHDAMQNGHELSEFLRYCADCSVLAINIKEEGIEERVIELTKSIYGNTFFLFDVAFPQAFRLGFKYREHVCLRMSEYELLDLEACQEFASYLWLDTFSGRLWLDQAEYTRIKKMGYRICFVSPELHRPPKGDVILYASELKDMVNDREVPCDFICTKRLEPWL